MQFNSKKSHCIAFGKLYKKVSGQLTLGDSSIHWVDSIKYLGVHLVSGKSLSFDVGPVKRSFYAASNCIFSRTNGLNELMQLFLQESYCLPILTYAIPALFFKPRQLSELNACWNSVYRRIFKYNQWESVRLCVSCLGRLDFHHITYLRRVSYFKRLLRNSVGPFMVNVLWLHFQDCFDSDICCRRVYLPMDAVVTLIYDDFKASLHSDA